MTDLRPPAAEGGATLIEIVFMLAMTVTLSGMAIPLVSDTIDTLRTASAARYIATRIGAARIDAVRSCRATALKFEAVGNDYRFVTVADGNANGVRAADIRDGTDTPLGPFERLADKFPGVQFALAEGVPDADLQIGTGSEGVRIGAAQILTMSADGTATSGTLYIRGRRCQFAVRVLGVTGRTRVLEYRPGDRTWMSR